MIKLGRICLTLLQVHVVSNSGHHMCVLCSRALLFVSLLQ